MKLALVLGVVLTACGDDAPGADAGDPTLDAGDPTGDAAPPPAIVVPETDGSLDLPFSMSASGEGTDRVGAIDLPGGVGTVEIHGRVLPALVHQQQPWPDFSYTLYQTIAVAEDAWYVLWLYCTEADEIAHVYLEGTDGTDLDSEPASGSCTGSATPSTIDVAFPGIDLAIDSLVEGFTATGPALDLRSGAPGSVILGAGSMDVLIFSLVDCTTTCGGTPWYELHAILWDEVEGRACFGIFYLYPDAPDSISLTYSLTLPDLEDLVGFVTLDATWSRD